MKLFAIVKDLNLIKLEKIINSTRTNKIRQKKNGLLRIGKDAQQRHRVQMLNMHINWFFLLSLFLQYTNKCHPNVVDKLHAKLIIYSTYFFLSIVCSK